MFSPYLRAYALFKTSAIGLKQKETRFSMIIIKRVSLVVTLLFCVFLFELFDPSFGIHQFLLAGEEGVTTGTNIDMYGSLGRPCSESGPTGAYSFYFLDFRMNSLFHS